MRERKRATSRSQPQQPLLLVTALVAALAALVAAVAGSSYGHDGTDGTSAPLSAQATEISLVGGTPSVPLAATPPEPGPETMLAADPVRLQIPSIGVDSELMDLGLQPDGTLEVPPSGFPAGWYTGAPTPGELGPAIIAGHVDWAGQPGVFFDLRDLSSGDEIAVTRQDGSTARFRVTRVEQFPKDEFPTQAVYGDLDHAGLRLITCDGEFDRQVGSYDDNLVVFAELVGSDAPPLHAPDRAQPQQS